MRSGDDKRRRKTYHANGNAIKPLSSFLPVRDEQSPYEFRSHDYKHINIYSFNGEKTQTTPTSIDRHDTCTHQRAARECMAKLFNNGFISTFASL